jgi:hypothetical protein
MNVTGSIFGKDIGLIIRKAVHDGTPELARDEVERVIDRTPILTGALRDDVEGDGNTDPSSDELAYIRSGTQNQLAEWNRVYVQYQEGPDLGVTTWTNAPHQMYAQVGTTDIPALEAWALSRLSIAASLIGD